MVGRTLKEMPREEFVVSTKAGFLDVARSVRRRQFAQDLLNSLDQSLQRLGLDYVDIFYSHRPDPHTPLEETLRALDQVVRQGKALYVGLSNYPARNVREAFRVTRELNLAPTIVAQKVQHAAARHRTGLFVAAHEPGAGVVAFSVLGQGLLSTKYQSGLPENSRQRVRGNRRRREKITPIHECENSTTR